jgi:transketolase
MLAWRSINTVRVLAMEAVERAQSGHPGTPMALAPAAYILWTRYLRHDPTDPAWPDRDRFVLSCGHASMLLYSLLHLSGYDLPLEELKAFRQWGSRTPGHPEYGHTPGVETTTGPLGQGFGNAVGMALAERLLAHRFNRPGHTVVDHRTWVFASDGDLMEGLGSEAASLAGHLRLGKLNVVYDDNRITIDGPTSLSFSEDVGRRFEAYGWQVLRVDDGNDLDAIDAAMAAAIAEADRPTLIVLRTVIGDPAPTRRNTAKAHGEPLGAEEVAATKRLLGWPDEPFFVPEEALADWRQCIERGRRHHAAWDARFRAYAAAHPHLAEAFQAALNGDLPEGWDRDLPSFSAGDSLATRQASQQVLDLLVERIPTLAGGSADLSASTGVVVKHGGTFGPEQPGRSFHWGVREHAMAAALNGMALHGGVRPYGSTFLVFSDYMKPAIRLAALMRLPVIYVFSHDSIGLGEDGPTHQPVEHLAMLRGIPGMTVIRPADPAETVQAWRAALLHRSGPVALVLTRQKVPVLDRTSLAPATGLHRGAYVLLEPAGDPQAILLASGSEVSVALAAAQRLAEEGVRVRVVSFPSWEVFDQQPESYRREVLPPQVRTRVSVEAASSFGWLRWVTEDGAVVALDRFGASAPGARLLAAFGFTPDHVAATVRSLLARGESR